jgi:acyl carrier protein
MGLDAVELVMEVEDRFSVDFSDAECQRLRTVADLAALVISKLPKSRGRCPTARAFFDFRKLLTEHAGVERRRIRPRARLDELIQPRRTLWGKLRRQDRRLPRLVATDRQDRVFLWMGAVLVFAWLMASAIFWGVHGAGLVVPASAAALVGGIFAFVSVTGLFRRHFPAGIETVGDLARVLAPVEMPQHGPGERLIVQQRVLEEVRRITALQLGLPLEKVRPESDFVRDLEID